MLGPSDGRKAAGKGVAGLGTRRGKLFVACDLLDGTGKKKSSEYEFDKTPITSSIVLAQGTYQEGSRYYVY